MKSVKGNLFIVGAAVFWGTSAVLARVRFNRQVDPFVLVQTRVNFTERSLT